MTYAAFPLYRITFHPIQKCSFSLAFALYRITFHPIQKCSFSLAFTLYRYSFGAVQVQNCSSFLAGAKLYLIAGTKLYRITLSSANAWLIRTIVSDQKSDLVQCKRSLRRTELCARFRPTNNINQL